jgi:NRAMP (natural resistance-associated macrophage protein)-like metal ion transporter
LAAVARIWLGVRMPKYDPLARIGRVLRSLGPGLVTGAADDDPSGIATYSQIGAQFGTGMGWVMLFSYPLMSAIQAVSARIGCVTGTGIAANLRRHYPPWLMYAAVMLLLVANVANLGADLGAMGAALQLLIGGPRIAYTIGFGVVCVALETFLRYRRYAEILRLLTLSLFAYVAVVFAVHVHWLDALRDLVLPTITLDRTHMEALVAVLGTTISPYLFFWQAAEEVEDQREAGAAPLRDRTAQAAREFARIDTDTWVGMAYSNLVSLAIIIATAATLHQAGVTDIQSSSQAAQALRPIGGAFTFLLFASGIIGTGMLAIPVLAGASAYAVCESFGWVRGLNRPVTEAGSFYGVIAAATAIGAALNLTPLDPVRALYWSAVLNGLLAAPLMATMMLMVRNPRVMGALVLPGYLWVLGWVGTAVMAVASVAFLALSFRAV